jgi:hypothetical protein
MPLLSPGKHGNLKRMKRAYLYVVAFLAVIGTFYLWNHRDDFSSLRAWLPSRSSEDLQQENGSQLQWQPVSDPTLGFKVEMPGAASRVVVQANSETGGAEPISMLTVKPESNRTYAVAWAEKPPIARINDLLPDRTLDQARDGALSRTESTLISEVRSNPQGFPGRDIVAHNRNGGMLDIRLIYAAPRLYMLMATSPSASGRHEEEIMHFFNSFAIASNTQIPETLPATR